jgi:spermidine/putrescine transport system ATP-binding protein
MLELRGLQKHYGTMAAVREASFTIRDGEFFSLLGPSGCGKTTLLRMIAGFESPSVGELHYSGRRIDTVPANERQFNMVFQRYALFPHLVVAENVAFGLKMKKVPAAEIRNRVEEALALVKMESFSGRRIDTLSGGQQQRIALARALVNRPKVLLLDEPLSALDLKLRQQMQVELLALQRRLGHTFIFVTHDQDEALTLSDRIAVMNQGVVEQIGTPQEIYEYPKTPFVAKFIGSINSLTGEVRECRADALVVHATGTHKRTWVVKPSRDGVRPLPAAAVGTSVRILVRPEKLRILKSAPGTDQNAIEGHLKEVLYQGPVTQFFVRPRDENAETIIVAQPNTAMSSRRAFSVGDKIFVAWSPEDCLVMGMEAALPAAEISSQQMQQAQQQQQAPQAPQRPEQHAAQSPQSAPTPAEVATGAAAAAVGSTGTSETHAAPGKSSAPGADTASTSSTTSDSNPTNTAIAVPLVAVTGEKPSLA